jgi:hypothetical protein
MHMIRNLISVVKLLFVELKILFVYIKHKLSVITICVCNTVMLSSCMVLCNQSPHLLLSCKRKFLTTLTKNSPFFPSRSLGTTIVHSVSVNLTPLGTSFYK